MRVRIEVEAEVYGDGDSESDAQEVAARSLYRWLGDDPDVGEKDIVLSLVPRNPAPVSRGATPGYMGLGLDTIEVVFNGSVQLAQLALAVAAWRLARPRPPRVRIERGGTTVLLDCDNPEAIRRAMAALEGTESEPEPGPGPDVDREPAPRPDEPPVPPAAAV
jgi:hypothetical protein